MRDLRFVGSGLNERTVVIIAAAVRAYLDEGSGFDKYGQQDVSAWKKAIWQDVRRYRLSRNSSWTQFDRLSRGISHIR